MDEDEVDVTRFTATTSGTSSSFHHPQGCSLHASMPGAGGVRGLRAQGVRSAPLQTPDAKAARSRLFTFVYAWSRLLTMTEVEPTELDILFEDDEFEEFVADSTSHPSHFADSARSKHGCADDRLAPLTAAWEDADEDEEDVELWEENWNDDDDAADAFSQQLREELAKIDRTKL